MDIVHQWWSVWFATQARSRRGGSVQEKSGVESVACWRFAHPSHRDASRTVTAYVTVSVRRSCLKIGTWTATPLTLAT